MPMFKLQSLAFDNGDFIPDKYAEIYAVSPPLKWKNVPAGTKSFALAITDPDTPAYFNMPRVFAHWMVYNIPASTTSLAEGVSPGGTLPEGALEVNNDVVKLFGMSVDPGYFGPWPPDATHRYVFNLYALKTDSLDIPVDADYSVFVSNVIPQTISSATLIGLYGPAVNPLPGS